MNGKPVEVRLEPDGTFLVGDREGVFSIVETERGVWSALVDGRSFEVIEEEGAYVVEGERVKTEIVDPRSPRRSLPGSSVEGRQTLAASMPGKIVRVLVAEGDTVVRGQGVVVVEAMKMQNEVKSPKDGRVVSLAAVEGTTVNAGAVLAIVE